MNKNEPEIDFDRLEKIYKKVGIPLVFHGGTGLGHKIIEQASRLGVRKINIGTLIKNAFTTELKRYFAEYPDEIDPRKILGQARENVVRELRDILQMFGASRKNWYDKSIQF